MEKIPWDHAMWDFQMAITAAELEKEAIDKASKG